MVRVEVKSSEVVEVSGVDKRGRAYLIRKQYAYLDTGKAYPVEVTIRLRGDQEAFPPGHYVVVPQCFYVARYGEVGVDLSRMQPARSVAPSKVAEARAAL